MIKSNFLSAACLVKKRDKYLFSRREDNGLWELPGGKIEKDETVTQAAKRELLEETGLTVSSAIIIGEWNFKMFGKIRKVAVVSCGRPQGKIKTSAETPEVAFLSSKLQNKLLPSHTLKLLRQLNKQGKYFILTAESFDLKTVLKYTLGKVKRFIKGDIGKQRWGVV